MSLLGVPEFTPFLPVFTSSTTTPTPMTGIRLNPCATPFWGGPPGYEADPPPNTGYEPKFCIDVSSEHTPINLLTRKSSFQLESDATIPSSKNLNLPRHAGASSSSWQTAASTLLKLGSAGTRSWKLAADVDHETIVPSVFESVSREKRDRDLNVEQTLKDRHNVHKFLERQAESAVRGEKLAQQRLFEAEADVEVNLWAKRKSDIALYDVNPEFESQRLHLQLVNQWADEAQREKISLCGESEMRTRLFRENRAKDCQEIEELRRVFCEETDRAR